MTQHSYPIDANGERICACCGGSFPATAEFYFAESRQRLGIMGRCKACFYDYPSQKKSSRKVKAIWEPSVTEQVKLTEFEERVICQPMRLWAISMAKEGYSHRWMANASGLKVRTVRTLLDHWGIKTSAMSKTHYANGAFPIAFRLKKDGIYSRSMAESVGKFMRCYGLSYQDAVKRATHNRKTMPLMTWLREVKGVTDRAVYVQLHKWVSEGISREDAFEIAMKRRTVVADAA